MLAAFLLRGSLNSCSSSRLDAPQGNDLSALSAPESGTVREQKPVGGLTAGPIVSQEQAIALAVNELSAAVDGYVLENPQYTASFTASGLHLSPRVAGRSGNGSSPLRAPGQPVAYVEAPASARNDGSLLVSYNRGGLTERYVIHGATSSSIRFQPPRAGATYRRRHGHDGRNPDRAGEGWLWSTDARHQPGRGPVTDATGSGLPRACRFPSAAPGLSLLAVLSWARLSAVDRPGDRHERLSHQRYGGDLTVVGYTAVAYNSTDDEYLVVWNGAINSSEFEIFGQRVNAATGAQLGANDFRISDTGPDGDAAFDTSFPAVAYNSIDNEYLVVWGGRDDRAPLAFEYEISVSGSRHRCRSANDFRISDIGPWGDPDYGAFEPAVAYNSTNNVSRRVVRRRRRGRWWTKNSRSSASH
jgi:hypothetical protein